MNKWNKRGPWVEPCGIRSKKIVIALKLLRLRDAYNVL